MKKILPLLAVFMLTTTAYAEKLIVTYDNTNTLYAVSRYEEEKDYNIKDGHKAYIYDMEKDKKEEYKKKEVVIVPEPELPAPLPEPELPERKYPEIYRHEIDAISTFAIVKNVSQVLINDEVMWNVEVLYQGKDKTFIIAEDVYITSAPDYWNDLKGCTADSLKKGDIINITASINGRIREIGFITRIEGYEIITDETDYGYDFEMLFSENGTVSWGNTKYPVNRFGKHSNEKIQYQFGVICDKRGQFYKISNKAGKFEEMTDIIVMPETIVYVCDFGRRFSIEMGTIEDIRHSYINSADMDSERNIINWSEDTDYVYALSRTVDGIATDVVVFYNLD